MEKSASDIAIEQAQREQAAEVAAQDTAIEIKRAAVADILADLKEFLADAPDTEVEGLQAAIEVIAANYHH